METWIRSGGTPRSINASAEKRIMISGPTMSAVAEPGSKRLPATSFGTTPTLPRQPLFGTVDRDVDLEVVPRSPAFELRAESEICGSSRAVEQRHLAVVAPVTQDA